MTAILESELSCPACGDKSVQTMPTDAGLSFHACAGCAVRLRPLAGDCCVFCGYGSVKCPPKQFDADCCG